MIRKIEDKSSNKNKTILNVKNIHKCFGKLKVLNEVNLDLKKREKVIIIGPSGGGKSTLLRCIMGLEIIQEGEIRLLDQPYIKSEPNYYIDRKLQRDIGMVFQSFNLFPHMTVLDNLLVAPTYVYHRQKSELTEKVKDILGQMNLEDKINEFPSRLSGGQCQRVAIARALMLEPKLMLFDEVTSALDPELVSEVLKVMKKLGEAGMTMLIVTHEMQFARDVGDKVVFIDEGKIIEQNDPVTLFTNPCKKRTIDFLAHLKKEDS